MREVTVNTDWMARIDGLRDLIEQEGPIGEAQKTLSAPVVEALVDAGLFAMQVPAELGGGGAGVLDMLETTEELVYLNGSIGWNVLAVSFATGAVGAFLDDEAARQLFDADPYPRVMGYGAPVGVATPVDGGYRLSGRFQFGSGIAQANWVMVAAPEPQSEPGPGLPEFRGFVVPVEQVTRLGNWDVYGLEATASEDFEIADVFVPREYTMANAGVSAPKRGQAFRRLGGLPTALLGNAAVPLGLARRALDEVAQLATRKARPGRLRIADQQLFRHDFAVHDAAVRAARAWTRDVATSGELAAERGAVTELDVQRCSQACVYNHRVGSAAVRFAYEWGGSAALRRQGRLGRVLVDMAAATQHQANDPNLMADAGAFMIEPLRTQEDVAGSPLVPTSTAA